MTAYHVEGSSGVLLETSCIQAARSLVNSVVGVTGIIDGPVDYLRLRAKKKYGQQARDYPSVL